MKSPSEINDHLGFMVLAAPDKFRRVGPFGIDQAANLIIAFDDLRSSLALLDGKLPNSPPPEQLDSMMEASLEAYRAGDRHKGSHILQDMQDLLFPNRFEHYEHSKRLHDAA